MSHASWTAEPALDATLEENWLFRLRRQRFRSNGTGQTHDYYVMYMADAVNVIALTSDRQVLFVRQFRAGSKHDSLETPGGLLEPGEDPADAGARELREETGYVGDRPRVLSTVWSNPSLLTSKITTILIENAGPTGATAFDTHEELQIHFVPESEVAGMLDAGEIDHALVVQGLLTWLRFRDSQIQPEGEKA